MSKVGRRHLLAAGALAGAGAAAPALSAMPPAPHPLSPELERLTHGLRRLLDADGAPGLSDAQADAISQERDALLDRILAFRARSAADVLAKLQIADMIEPFADAAEEGDVKAIWTLSAMADLERLIGPSNRPR